MGITSSVQITRLWRTIADCFETRQMIKNSEEKDEYELDKHEVSKPPFFLSFCHNKCLALHSVIDLSANCHREKRPVNMHTRVELYLSCFV